ncbi:MAG: hypothetical protein JO202_09245 [Ktedonobacteraceae bacterium]|nr:hypothetical protein [Ktedonobacteraceae bacterium]
MLVVPHHCSATREARPFSGSFPPTTELASLLALDYRIVLLPLAMALHERMIHP